MSKRWAREGSRFSNLVCPRSDAPKRGPRRGSRVVAGSLGVGHGLDGDARHARVRARLRDDKYTIIGPLFATPQAKNSAGDPLACNTIRVFGFVGASGDTS